MGGAGTVDTSVYPKPNFPKEALFAWIAQYAPKEYGKPFARYMTDEIWPYCTTGVYESPEHAFRARTR